MELRYKYFPTPGPVLVLVHGLLGAADNWRFIAKKWAQQGLQVLAVDQRNHGFSPHSVEHNYTLLAEDLQEFVHKHQLEKPILLGHSMGAKTVMQYIKMFPEEASKIILADMAPRAYHHKDRHNATFNAILSIDLQQIQTRKEVEIALKTHLEKSELDLQHLQPDFSLHIPTLVPFLMKNLYTDVNEKLFWRFNVSALQNHVDDILSPIIFEQKITVPTLVLRGAESDYVSDADLEEMKKIFTFLQIETLPNAGHWLQADQPELFYEKILYFCQK